MAAAGFKAKALELLAVIKENPFQNPPPYEKLAGDLLGAYLCKQGCVGDLENLCLNPNASPEAC